MGLDLFEHVHYPEAIHKPMIRQDLFSSGELCGVGRELNGGEPGVVVNLGVDGEGHFGQGFQKVFQVARFHFDMDRNQIALAAAKGMLPDAHKRLPRPAFHFVVTGRL